VPSALAVVDKLGDNVGAKDDDKLFERPSGEVEVRLGELNMTEPTRAPASVQGESIVVLVNSRCSQTDGSVCLVLDAAQS